MQGVVNSVGEFMYRLTKCTIGKALRLTAIENNIYVNESE